MNNLLKTTCQKTGLIIDKIQDNVAFNETKYLYWNIDTGEYYTSVTTLLDNYNHSLSSEYDMTEDSQKETAIHKKLEDYVLSFENNRIKEYGSKTSLEEFFGWFNFYVVKKSLDDIGFNHKRNFRHQKNFLIPELLVYNHQLKLAGQIDLTEIMFSNNTVYFQVYDYKTNHKIDRENDFQKMKFKSAELDDCSYNHYNLQLYLYCKLLENVISNNLNPFYDICYRSSA